MHIFVTPPVLTVCPKCNKSIKAHIVCKHCGYYKGREVIDVLSKLTKKERKQVEKEMKDTEKDQKEASGAMTMGDLSKK